MPVRIITNFVLSLLLLLCLSLYMPAYSQTSTQVVSSVSMPLNDRYPQASVNDVFKDNILLTLAYMRGGVNPHSIDWNTIEKPFTYTFVLHKNQVLTFHNMVLPEFSENHTVAVNSDFSGDEGFKSDGYLYGDGVCHLASLMNLAAQHAGITVVAPTNHDFATIPDIPKKYGVAIYYNPEDPEESEEQNLYIKNTLPYDVAFAFTYDDGILHLNIIKENS